MYILPNIFKKEFLMRLVIKNFLLLFFQHYNHNQVNFKNTNLNSDQVIIKKKMYNH